MTKFYCAQYKNVDNTDTIFLLTIDCHYQAARFATINNKSPNFYTI